MRISTHAFVAGQGIKNIRRNKLFSLAAIATMVACIFLFSLFFAVILNFRSLMTNIESQVGVTVFFQTGTKEEDILKFKAELEKRDEVATVKYVSAQEAWETVKKDYFQGNEELAAGWTDDNPVANSANLEVQTKRIDKQEAVVKYIKSNSLVRKVSQAEGARNTLSAFNRLATYLSIGIIVLLFAVSIFLISNTVHIGITVRREEITIMKLTGARDYLVRAPFIIEGMLIGLIGSLIPLTLLYFVYGKATAYVMEKFSILSGYVSFVPIQEVFRIVGPVGLVLGLGIGFLGSYFTVRKYLSV
ncbi:MAG: permease-like cell division protein FtsX [Lachnospiraceae bacterium]|nr:permease-like cell division protein FtsX [Lachnospiraceae bacterium]MDY5742892.1 permease-like cell division protein FtsX [Lachnospiraceae bacterium]